MRFLHREAMVICGVAAAHPLLTYPPRTLRCGCSRCLASDALLRHLQGACGQVSTRALGAPRFLNTLQRPNAR